MTQLVEDLKAARKLLRKVGFTKHQLVQLDGYGKPVGYCSLGAVNTAVTGRPSTLGLNISEYAPLFPRVDAAITALQEQLHLQGKISSITQYNDLTNAQAVDELFTATIESAKEKQA